VLTDTTGSHSRTAASRGLLIVGCVAVLLPAIYMTLVGRNSGEHSGTVILFGLAATAFQLVVWSLGWCATRHRTDAARHIGFGAGAASGLVASLGALALTGRPAWAVTTYLVVALLTVTVVALPQSRHFPRAAAG
jgi:hypothetical protein